MWRWLLDVHRRLDVVVELFDEKLTLLLPALDTAAAFRARRLLRPFTSEALRNIVQRSMRNLTQETIAAAGLHFSCTPIVVAGRATGALLVGQEEGVSHLDRLERVGSWLASAIERHMASFPVDDPSELRQLSSLYRLFDQAIATGSEIAVVRVFVEALAIWEDVECRAYVADLAGRFSLAVSLPGSDPGQAPLNVVLDARPAAGATSRPSASERKRLGFPEATQILLASVEGRVTARWLIVASVPTDARQAARLSLYLDVLVQAVTSATAVELARLTWAVTQHLLLHDSPQAAVHATLAELSATIKDSSCFSLFRSDGLDVLTVGEASSILVLPAPTRTPHLLILRVAIPPPYAAVIGVRKAGAGAFNHRHEKLAEATASILSAWLKPLMQRLTSGDRRLPQRTFDQVIEEYDHDATTLDDLSMIVVSIGDAFAPPSLARGWINKLRGQLRPTDLVGRLLSGDVGILLLHTADDGAQVVVRRLHKLMADTSQRDLPPHARLGVATRLRGAPQVESIVEQATAQATRWPESGRRETNDAPQ
jgi:hypothetical protein